LAMRLRKNTEPIVTRIAHDMLLFDPRTVLPEQDEVVLHAICEVLRVG
jgi:hypothetical protein